MYPNPVYHKALTTMKKYLEVKKPSNYMCVDKNV